MGRVAKGHPASGSGRPYDCRGSFVSLHPRAGASPLEVAQWAGHSPAVTFRHYANVIEELRGEPILPVHEQITRARELVLTSAPAELDRMVDDLLEHPTVIGGGSAAALLFSPPTMAPLRFRPPCSRRSPNAKRSGSVQGSDRKLSYHRYVNGLILTPCALGGLALRATRQFGS